MRVVDPGTDDGTGNPLPVPGAFVMVGVMAGNPFAGNYGFANTTGEITFSDPSLFGPQTVTAGANGYQYFSFVNVDRSEIEVPLQVKAPVFNRSKVSGGVSGFSGSDCDNRLQLVLLSTPLTVESLMGLSPAVQETQKEPATVLGSTMYLDSNIFIPTQKEWPDSPLMCYFFGLTIRKTSYSLYLPTGTTQNIAAVGLELPLTGTLDLGQMNTLKLGLERNFNITGNRTLNPALTHSVAKNLTLNVSNTPAGTNVLLMSLGEINGDPGLAPGAGELLTLGFGQMAGGSPGSRSVNTIARTSPFLDLRYLALASASYPEGASQSGDTTVLDRGDYLPPATRSLSSFLRPVQLAPVAGNLFSFSNAYNPGISPHPDVNFITLALVTTVPDTSPGAGSGDTVDVSQVLWRLVSPGDDLAFYLPLLPPGAPEPLPNPAQTPENDRLVWRHNVLVLGLDPAFDFDSFGLSQIGESITHYSANERVFNLTLGCVVDADCDDGNLCNGIETCAGGVCQPGTPLVCDDGVFCNGVEWCDPAVGCRPGTPPDCNDGIPCTANYCDAASDQCAFTDHCAGIYVSPSCPANAYPGGPVEILVTITDGSGVDQLWFDLSYDPSVLQYINARTTGYLLDGWVNVGCIHAEGVVSCYAGSATPLPQSTAGVLFGLNFSVRPDANTALTQVAITDLRHDLALMSTTPCSIFLGDCTVDADCNDGNVCNGIETCVAGVCQPGTPLVCDDGVFCNGVEWCDPAAGCMPGTPPDCDDGIPCTENFCDPVTDQCAFTNHCSGIYVSPSCPGNAQPGDLIEVQVTVTDASGVDVLGFDVSHDPSVLQYINARTTGYLLDGWVNVGCNHTEGVVSCHAGSATPLPQSSTGVLFGLNFSVRPGTNGTLTPVSVTDLRDDLALMSTTPCSIFIGDCTVDADCDDGNVCNGSETCVAGVCQPGTPLVCDDGNACTHNTCHPTTGCVFTCKAFNWEDPCCQDPACAGVPICREPPPGCFIATASFGTEMSGKIDVLRQFRDQVLLGGRAGTGLVTAYYRWSPPIAEFIEERPAFKALVRVLLLPVVGSAHLLQ